jgi:hypothetical protein
MFAWFDRWELWEAVASVAGIALLLRYWQRLLRRKNTRARQREERLRSLGS